MVICPLNALIECHMKELKREASRVLVYPEMVATEMAPSLESCTPSSFKPRGAYPVLNENIDRM